MPSPEYILGLDLGSNSIGWAALRAAPDGSMKPVGVLAMGTRIFDSGSKGKLELGLEESRNATRRTMRQLRRQHDRSARRIDFIYLRLQLAGLLPELPGQKWMMWNDAKLWHDRSRQARAERSRLRHDVLNKIDHDLFSAAKDCNTGGVSEATLPHRIPYLYRALSLDEQLPLHAVGRALLHLAQRRGFLSNRKTDDDDGDKKKELGKVKKDIQELGEAIETKGSRTLGEFFLHSPEDERVRGKWTSRKMYEAEFDAIWSGQARFNPEVFSDAVKNDLHRAIFRQRPLKSQKQFIGACPWEKDVRNQPRRRAPIALLSAQRRRMLQMVNNAKIGDMENAPRLLTGEEREKLIGKLETDGDATFAEAKKLLGLKRTAKFNFEEGDEKKFIGNRTAAKMAGVFGLEAWKAKSEEEKNRIVEIWRSIDKNETLRRHAQEKWGLDGDAAKKFAGLHLEPGYCAVSRQALDKILPALKRGLTYPEACKEVYGERQADTAAETLPLVEKAMPSLRNPTVERILTELRKVVNALIAEYGRPMAIRIELARELRKSKKARQARTKRMRDQETLRKKAAESALLKEAGISNPTRADIEKVLLHQECRGCCPYTGKQISARALFDGTFQVEHIIPFSISLDDSFLNKTLCHNEANRLKSNRTPWRAFGHDEQRWHGMRCRIKSFPGGMSNPKVQRFLSEEAPQLDGFVSQQLNDTCHASKEAMRYLGLLYGDEANTRVQAARGGVTAFLRDEWGLNSVLGDGGGKNRDDHRHHAVDAVVIALTDKRAMQALSDAAVRAAQERRRRFGRMAPPWSGFLDGVKEAVHKIVVSHRVSRKVSGALHEETYYGPGPERDKQGNVTQYHIRKPLHSLSDKDILSVDTIVDKAVREAVQAKYRSLPKADPKLFENPEHNPCLLAKNGRRIPIKKVRIRMPRSVLPVGSEERRRYAVGGNNHHAEIVAVLNDKNECIGMDWEVVAMFEAYRRRKAHEPIIRRDHGENRKFLFSLGSGESATLLDVDNIRRVFFCRCASKDVLAFTPINDARLVNDIKKDGEYIQIQSGRKLFAMKPEKITVSPLGKVHNAHE